ncbi:MAG: DNA primase [Bacteroidales bacterium]
MQSLIEKVKDLDIVDVVQNYGVSLKRAGASYKGLCPFHNEKTPSFNVHPVRNSFHCFGCGKGGSLIDFVMDKEGLSFIDAVKKIAMQYSIPIPEYSEQAKKANQDREEIFIINKAAASYFQASFKKLDKSHPAKKYAHSRWSDDQLSSFAIGYAPDDWQLMMTYLAKAGYKKTVMMKAGLIKEKNNRKYVSFKHRLMFPLFDKFHRVVGFTARALTDDKKQPKYVNTPETEVYKKSRILYGLSTASMSMREKETGYLVEGNPDVIKMQSLGVTNTVATGGTALTPAHVNMLKKYVKSICIIGDSDSAGKKAVERSGEIIVKAGLYCKVLPLPDDEKHDPDSFFTSKKQFQEYRDSNMLDFFVYYTNNHAAKAKSPDFKSKLIGDVCDLLAPFSSSYIDMILDQLAQIDNFPKKTTWATAVKEAQKEIKSQEDPDHLPADVNAVEFEKYGFYEVNNCYTFSGKNGNHRGSNFIMKPLFHVQSVINAKRLFEIVNEFKHTEVIELAQKDLISLSAFRLRVESLGNFIFEGSESDLNKLKRYLYEKTQTCVEITQLGWQKDGFFAWGNGVYADGFKRVNEFGIVTHEDKNYYLPAFSKIYQHEQNLFINERRFVHSDDNNVTLQDYSQRLVSVYGPNAMMAIAFYTATLFRDIIVSRFGFFPILNLFGQKGAGKTEMAISLMAFFGKDQKKGINITNSTKAALSDHVAQVSNACCHIDEYRNDIELEKVEFLKGLWDGTGRNRMNMDKDKKKEVTNVDCGVLLSGQQMPTADIALFSRMIYITFDKTEFNDDEKEAFKNLKSIEKKGLTHISNQIMQYRKYFINNYKDVFNQTAKTISAKANTQVEDRIFNNWVVILSAFRIISDKVPVAFSFNELLDTAVTGMIEQNKETVRGNEVATFWRVVEFLDQNNQIVEGADYRLDTVDELVTNESTRQFHSDTKVLMIQQSGRILPLYRKEMRNMGEHALPYESMQHYLTKDKRFLGKKKSVRFDKVDKSGIVESSATEGYKSVVKQAMCFLYDDLDISIGSVFEKEDDTDPFAKDHLADEREEMNEKEFEFHTNK